MKKLIVLLTAVLLLCSQVHAEPPGRKGIKSKRSQRTSRISRRTQSYPAYGDGETWAKTVPKTWADVFQAKVNPKAKK